MRTVDGIIVPGLGTEEVHKIWVVFACVLVPFLIFEAVAFFYINTGKRTGGDGSGRKSGLSIELRPRLPSGKQEGNCSGAASDASAVGDAASVSKTGEAPSQNGGGGAAPMADYAISVGPEQVQIRGQDFEDSLGQSTVVGAEGTHELLPRRMDAIEGLRIVGAIHIVLFHFYTFENQTRTCLPCKLGNYWVHVYFMITGFVSYKSCARTDSASGGLRLLERRLKSLYPIVFISYLITYVGKAMSNTWVTSITTQRLLFLVSTFTPPFNEASELNGPAWFIGTLTLYWLALPHWCIAAKRASLTGLATMAFIVYAASFAPHIAWYGILGLDSSKSGDTSVLQGMITFSPYTNWTHVPMGVILAAALDRFRFGKLREFLEQCGASVGGIALLLFVSLYRQKDQNTLDLYRMLINGPFSYPVLIILFVGCSQERDPVSKVFKFFGRWGRFSLPLYILHFPINNFLRDGCNCPSCVSDGAFYDFLLLPVCLVIGSYLGAKFQDRWNAYIAPKKTS